MPNQETSEWPDKGTEPPAGAEAINGEEEYPSNWMNNHFWKITTDLGTLFAWNDDLETEIGNVESGLSNDIQAVIDDLAAHEQADNPHPESAAVSDLFSGQYGDLSGVPDVFAPDQHGDADHDDTVASTDQLYTDEQVEDTVSALLQGGPNVDLSYDDAGNTLTIGTSALSEEEVEDTVASLLTADSNLTLSYDDGADTLTVGLGDDISVTSIDAEHASVSNEMSAGSLSGDTVNRSEPITSLPGDIYVAAEGDPDPTQNDGDIVLYYE